MILKKLKYSIYLVFINYINFLLMDFINTMLWEFNNIDIN